MSSLAVGKSAESGERQHLSVSLSICQSAFVSLYFSVCICQSTFVSVYFSVCLSHLSVCLSHLSVSLSHLSVCLSHFSVRICQSTLCQSALAIFQSAFVSLHLSVCLICQSASANSSPLSTSTLPEHIYIESTKACVSSRLSEFIHIYF